MNIKLDYSDVKFKDNGKLKLLIIVGTRPEIIRLAAVINKCRKYFDTVLAHTGQNYDYNLNGVFFKDLKLENPDVYIASAVEDLTIVLQLAQALRNAGLGVEVDLMGRSLKAQFKYADKLNARFVAVIGEDELQNQEIALKDMVNGTQERIKLTEVVKNIIGRL